MYQRLITIIFNLFVLQIRIYFIFLLLVFWRSLFNCMLLYTAHFCYLFVYVVPQSSMDDVLYIHHETLHPKIMVKNITPWNRVTASCIPIAE